MVAFAYPCSAKTERAAVRMAARRASGSRTRFLRGAGAGSAALDCDASDTMPLTVHVDIRGDVGVHY
ncbi:hypothetical protein Mro03_78400 [Microbispora rosea subsp. rosea]|nr:hypothetical protein Mro03_78400 [Microbispora rosea subsp. rosea]